jgi:hypothetical protein
MTSDKKKTLAAKSPYKAKPHSSPSMSELAKVAALPVRKGDSSASDDSVD